jgi:hypothetical protein
LPTALATWRLTRKLKACFLGHLIAHELGHLLLDEAGHRAGAGIMHTPWKTKELEQVKQGVMFFLPGQVEKIRAQVRARKVSSVLTAAEPQPKITVFVYNYAAAVAPDVLA